jgi:4-oxalocrotonate tautomerase
MPLARIDLRRGKSADYKKAICDAIYRALRETFNVPEEDRFMVVTDHEAEDFIYSRTYFDIPRGDDFVIIQLTVSNTRTVEQKKDLYARLVALLAENPGLRPQDVFINLVEVDISDWSFGNGIAQYVDRSGQKS